MLKSNFIKLNYLVVIFSIFSCATKAPLQTTDNSNHPQYKTKNQVGNFIFNYNLYSPNNFKIVASDSHEIERYDEEEAILSISTTKIDTIVVIIFQFQIRESSDTSQMNFKTKPISDKDYIEIKSKVTDYKFEFKDAIELFEIIKKKKFHTYSETICIFEINENKFDELLNNLKNIETFNISFFSNTELPSRIRYFKDILN